MSIRKDFSIRRARREDCAQMMGLIRELAAFERAPDEVTVSLAHFEESGFGAQPVWHAFVACAPGMESAEAAQEEMEQPMMESSSGEALENDVQETPAREADIPTSAAPVNDGFGGASFIQLPGPVEPLLPEAVREALPFMQEMLPSEEIIGMALCYIRYSTWKGQRLYLEDIIVTESWRGKGVGTALMEALIAEAKASGRQGISWQVLAWNEAAIKFYERFGARFDRDWINGALEA